jgi:prepilin-type N-terminal cleavage/methylation domain-containing protein
MSRLTRHRGLTLPELMISLALTSIMVAVIVTMLIVSMRVWRKVSAVNQAYPPAYRAVNAINDDLRGAAYVKAPNDSNWIVIYPPLTTTDATTIAGKSYQRAVPQLTVDKARVRRYYISDASGNPARTGTFLWVHEFTQNENNTVTTRSKRVLAENCITLRFPINTAGNGRIYDARCVALTIQGQEGNERYESQYYSTIPFINPLVDVVPADPILN